MNLILKFGTMLLQCAMAIICLEKASHRVQWKEQQHIWYSVFLFSQSHLVENKVNLGPANS